MSKERYDHLHELVQPLITKKDTHFRKSISSQERLIITLRYLSTGCSQQSLSYAFRVGRSTVSEIIKNTCDAIYQVLSPLYLKPPTTIEEWKKISEDFEDIWNMPHVIGALDGKHIAMDCPKNSGTQDYNYKGFFSLNLLAICDARYNFTMVDVGQYGSNNDSGVLLNSEMGQNFEDSLFKVPPEENVKNSTFELPYYLVGDEIFPLKTWLMRPFPGKLTEEQRIFNYRLSRARRVIENTFGILVARWRLFRGPIRADRENVLRYVLAAISLHNYLRLTDSATYCPNGFVDSEDSTGRIKKGEWRRIVAQGNAGLQPMARVRGSRYQNRAIEMRSAIMRYLNSDEGSVPWQLEYVRKTGKE